MRTRQLLSQTRPQTRRLLPKTTRSTERTNLHVQRLPLPTLRDRRRNTVTMMSFQSVTKNRAVASDLHRHITRRIQQAEKGEKQETFEAFMQLVVVKHGYTIDDLKPIITSFGLEIVQTSRGFELQKIGGETP